MKLFTTHVLAFFKEHLSTLSGNYLEIGVYNGVSIKEMAIAYPDRLIIGVDPFIEDGCTSHNSGISFGKSLELQKTNTISNIANIDNIKLYETTSEDFFRDNVEFFSEFNVSAIFVDGSHHYKDVVSDYKLAMALLDNKCGFICFDDLQVPDVLSAILEFETEFSDRILDKTDIGETTRVYKIKDI